jgi:prophage regulatory protein
MTTRDQEKREPPKTRPGVKGGSGRPKPSSSYGAAEAYRGSTRRVNHVLWPRLSHSDKEAEPLALPNGTSLPEMFVSTPTPLPQTGFVRLTSVIAPLGPIPVSRSTWWAGIKDGRYPKPVKLGPRITAWRVEDIRALIREGAA